MLNRRKLFGWMSGLIGGAFAVPAAASTDAVRAAVGRKMFAEFPGFLFAKKAKDDPLAGWRLTDEQIDQHRRLSKHKNLLLPGLYRWTVEDKDVLGRSVDFDAVGMWADALTVRSYNGIDRQERWFRLLLTDLDTRRDAVWAEAKAAILPPPVL